MPDLETEEEAAVRIAKTSALNKLKNKIDNFDEIVRNKEDEIDIFENYLNKKIGYDGINNIEKSIEDGIKIYQERRRTNKNKRIINNSNEIIKAI